MWTQLLSYTAIVAAGAAAGGALRFITMNVLVTSSAPGAGTMAVNLIGCVLIGVLTALLEHFGASRTLQLALVTGLLGGFTTFSTFALDAVSMLDRGLYAHCARYLFISVSVGIALCGLSLFGTYKLLQFLFPR